MSVLEDCQCRRRGRAAGRCGVLLLPSGPRRWPLLALRWPLLRGCCTLTRGAVLSRDVP